MSLFLMVIMKKLKNAVRLSLLPMTISLLILILFRFVFLLGYVPTASMEPALKTGSLLLGVRVWGDIQKGDIIVFRHNKEYLVKRVEAVEGTEKIWWFRKVAFMCLGTMANVHTILVTGNILL